jgi:hypothetical protein
MSHHLPTRDDYIISGQLRALQLLANEVRLDCARHGWHADAWTIKVMQDGIRALARIRYEQEQP